jgi:hypothetical protein
MCFEQVKFVVKTPFRFFFFQRKAYVCCILLPESEAYSLGSDSIPFPPGKCVQWRGWGAVVELHKFHLEDREISSDFKVLPQVTEILCHGTDYQETDWEGKWDQSSDRFQKASALMEYGRGKCHPKVQKQGLEPP